MYKEAVSTVLTGKQRRHLRALAHDRKPIIQIGHAGLTSGVIRAIDAALFTHELIKIRVLQECPEDAATLAPAIEAATGSSVAQCIGRILLVYKRRKENPKIVLPGAARTRNRE